MNETSTALDTYDVQEILRCIEVTYAVTEQKLGRRPEVYWALLQKWGQIMSELDISRYGEHQARVTLRAEQPASCGPSRG